MLWLLLIVVGLLVLAHHGPGAWRVVLKRTIYAFLIMVGAVIALVACFNGLLTVHP